MLEYTFTYNKGIFLSTDINAMKRGITVHEDNCSGSYF